MPFACVACPQGVERDEVGRCADSGMHRPADHHRHPEPRQPDRRHSPVERKGERRSDIPHQEEMITVP